MVAINQKIRRLPGFRFEAAAPARADVLPRMDVALFVGFALTGPIGVPVAVESAEQFRTIFGDDLPLVWDAAKSETVYSYLGATVRSFFRNGGRRCWVLRTARVAAEDAKSLNRACYNFFPLAGFARVKFGKNELTGISPAFARARAKGGWSDDLQVGTAVLSKSIGSASLNGTDYEKLVTLEISANESVATGDLLRFSFGEEKTVLLLAVDEIKTIDDEEKTQSPPKRIPELGKRIVEFASRRFVWLTELSAMVSPPAPTSPPAFIELQVEMWNGQRESNTENTPKSFVSGHPAVYQRLERESDDAPQKVSLIFSDLSASDTPEVGSILTARSEEGFIGLLVENVITGFGKAAAKVEIICQAVNCHRTAKMTKEPTQVERLTFELRVKKGEKSVVRLSDLAFNPGAGRFWGDLPADDELYCFFDANDKRSPAWTQNGDAASFPLVGSGDSEGFYFPLFAEAVPEKYLGAPALLGTKLERGGLAQFDEDLFLDEDLKNTGSGNLLNEAEFIRYLSSRPRALRGIHSALVPETGAKVAVESEPTAPSYTNYSLDECTIIAVPDAIHRGWEKSKDTGGILSPPLFSPPLRPEWWHFQDCRGPDIKKVTRPPGGKFLDCGIRFVKAPANLKIKEEAFTSGKFTLEWTSDETDENLMFVLQESASPNFEFPVELNRDKARNFEITPPKRAGIYFYRVRAETGKNFSDWSSGLGVKIPEAEDWAAKKEFEPNVLLAVQRALLRMCAVRGDLFAVLSVPEHFDETDVFAHVGTLKTTRGLTAATAGVEPFSADETRCLSFGAMYHPWLLTHEDDLEGFRNIPPDGALCGVMAKRSFERGAWIAPANEKLHGVIGLAKDINRARFMDFQDNLINLVRQEPRGFLVLDSDTLSDDFDWRSINVRRLIGLLRRLAVKHGAEYVFEPNDERFRRQVERGFSALLDLMFTRGAFAGTTPANSYQVVVSSAVNNFQSVEQGRFIVELRVAPSLPLKFVTVRLVQAGGRSNVVEVF